MPTWGFTRKGIQSFHLIKPQSHLSGTGDTRLKLWSRGRIPIADRGQFTQYQSYIDFLVRVLVMRGWILDPCVWSDVLWSNRLITENTGSLSINLMSHFNRMGGKNRRISCRKTVHNDKQEMFKESFSGLWLEALIHVCATAAAYSTFLAAQLHISQIFINMNVCCQQL